MKLLLLTLFTLASCATPKLSEAEKYELRKQRDAAEKQRLQKDRK
jgi:uncharacterized lipoprotein YmbA